MRLRLAKRKCMWIVSLTLVLFFALVQQNRKLQEIHSIGAVAAVSCILTLIYAGTMWIASLRFRLSRRQICLAGLVLGLSVLARAAMLDFRSADYDSFLIHWVRYFREKGPSALAENVGDYNLLYQYALLAISQIPLPDLYLIKLLTVCFDYALAIIMAEAAGAMAGEKTRLPMLMLIPLLPTVLLDGSCWGQCDPVYAFAVILSLYWLWTERPSRAAAALALAFAFKLQTIFVFPVVLFALLWGKYKPKHALVFFAAYFVTLLPALLMGRSLTGALSVYASQSMGQYYHRLTYNAPNLYLFFPMLEFASSQEYTWMRFIEGIEADGVNGFLTEDLFPTLQRAALLACILLVLAFVLYWLRRRKEIPWDAMPEFALFFAIFLPFVMPKIHDRYFFLADMLSLLIAARKPSRRFLPVLVIGASLGSYMTFLTRQRPMDERVLALMMFVALLVTGHDLLLTMRGNRAALSEGGVSR